MRKCSRPGITLQRPSASRCSNRQGHWPWLLVGLLSLIAALAILEAAGATHFSGRLAAALGGRSAYGTLDLAWDDPALRIKVDGDEIEETRVTKMNRLGVRLTPGWHLVEGYAGEHRKAGFHVRIQPGRSLELRLR